MPHTLDVVAVRDPDSMRCAQEVLRHLLDLPAIADRDGSIVAVGIVVNGLLVALETFHEGKEICGTLR